MIMCGLKEFKTGNVKFVPESAQLLQFRYWWSVGFNLKGLIVVQDFSYLRHRLERHRLTLKNKREKDNSQQQDNNLHCLSLLPCNTGNYGYGTIRMT